MAFAVAYGRTVKSEFGAAHGRYTMYPRSATVADDHGAGEVGFPTVEGMRRWLTNFVSTDQIERANLHPNQLQRERRYHVQDQ